MAIKYTGYDNQDTITVGSNQVAIVDGGAEVDTIKITADQTADVDVNLDATATIALQAGVSVASAVSSFGSQIVTLSNGATITAQSGATFTIGTQTVTMAELTALGANYTVTGNEAPASGSAPVMTDADSAITITEGTAVAMDSAVTVADAEGDFTAATLAFSDVGNAGTYALNGTTVYADTTNNYVIALDANSDEQVIGTVSGANSSDMTITLNSGVNTGIVETLIEGTTYTAADTGDQTLTVTLTDAAGNVMTHDFDTSVLSGTALALSALNDDLVVVARTDTATVNVDLGTNATVNLDDSNLDNNTTLDTQDMVGGTLTIALSGTTDASDQLSFLAAGATTAGFRMMGDVIVYDADGTDTNAATNEQVIGTLSGTGTAASPFEITFLTGVVDTDIQNLLQNLEFDTIDTATIGERTVTVTLTDAAGTNTATASTSMFVVNSFMTLTAAADVTDATVTPETDFTGTADTDAYQAAKGYLDNGDVLDGAGGVDFLLAEIETVTAAPTLTNIENLRLSVDTEDGELSFANTSHDTDGSVTITVADANGFVATNVGKAVGTINLSATGAADDSDVTSVTLLDTVGNVNGVLNYTGANGADTLVMAETLNASDIIDGGTESVTGTDNDTVTIDDILTADINGLDAATGALNISNFESITLTNVTAASVIDATNITGDALKTATGAFANDVLLDIAGADLSVNADVEVTVTNINDTINSFDNSGAAEVSLTFVGDADVTIASSGAGDLTVDMADTLDGADAISGATGAQEVTATFDGASTGAMALTVAAGGIAFDDGSTDANTTVTVTSTAHGYVVGDHATFGTITAVDAGNDAAAAALSDNTFVITGVTADTFTVTNSVAATTHNGVTTAASATVTDVSADGNTALDIAANVEVLNIVNSNNASTFDFLESKPVTTNISGDADVTINNIETATSITISAADDATATDSVMTGDLTLDIDNGVVAMTVTGGQGDDTFNFGSTSTIVSTDTIDGGAGTDSVTGTLATTAGVVNIDNVETITLNVDTATTLSLSGVAGDGTNAVTVNLQEAVADQANDDVTIVTVGSTITTLDASGLDTLTDDLTIGNTVNADNVAAPVGLDTDTEIGVNVTISADVAGVRTVVIDGDAAAAGVAVGDVIDLSGVALQLVSAVPDHSAAATDTDSDGTTDAAEFAAYLNANTFTVTAIDAGTSDGIAFEIATADLATTDVATTAAGVNYWDVAELTAGADGWTGDSVISIQSLGFGTAGTTLEAAAGDNVITGGTGADTFNFNTTVFDASDVINGAGGTDTLTAQITTDITPTIANVENITLTTTADLNLTTSGITHETDGAVSLTIAGSNKVVFTDMSAAIGSVDTSGASTAGLDITFDNSAARDFTVGLGAGQSDLFRLDLDANAQDAGKITISGFEAGDDLIDFRGAEGTTPSTAADGIDGLGDLIRTNVDLLDAAGNQVGSAAYTVADGVNDSVKITADSNYANVDFEINVVGVTSAEIVDSLVF